MSPNKGSTSRQRVTNISTDRPLAEKGHGLGFPKLTAHPHLFLSKQAERTTYLKMLRSSFKI